MNNNLTVVTGFYDIDRSSFPARFSRTIDLYLKYIKNMFSMNINLIIYTETKFIKIFEEFREKYSNKTIIFNLPFNRLPMYKFFDKIKDIHNKLDTSDLHNSDRPEVISPEYNILVNSKIGLVKKTIELNPFKSDYFAWIDAGYTHDRYNLLDRVWYPKSLFREANTKIVISKVGNLDLMSWRPREFYKQPMDTLSAGVMLSSGKFFTYFERIYNIFYEKILNEMEISDDEQFYLSLLAKYQPNFFHIVKENWYNLININ